VEVVDLQHEPVKEGNADRGASEAALLRRGVPRWWPWSASLTVNHLFNQLIS
jgi:hypothetical protein